MIETAEPHSSMPKRRRLSVRAWIVLGLVVVLVAGGVITAFELSFHYLHAEPLGTDGGGWLPPDNTHARSVEAGPYDVSIAAARPGHPQSFELDLNNSSSVSQTVLGLYDGKVLANPRLTGEPEHLAISRTAVFPENGPVTYTSDPVTIPPNGQYRLRFTLDTGHNWQPCRSEYWTSLYLRVRVGFFTRTEVLDLDPLILELHAPGNAC